MATTAYKHFRNAVPFNAKHIYLLAIGMVSDKNKHNLIKLGLNRKKCT